MPLIFNLFQSDKRPDHELNFLISNYHLLFLKKICIVTLLILFYIYYTEQLSISIVQFWYFFTFFLRCDNRIRLIISTNNGTGLLDLGIVHLLFHLSLVWNKKMCLLVTYVTQRCSSNLKLVSAREITRQPSVR